MASVDDVQPVDSTWLMPRRPSEIDISLDTMPQMPTAMAYGVTCRPPLVKKSWYWRSPTSMPPPPLPMITPGARFADAQPGIAPRLAAGEHAEERGPRIAARDRRAIPSRRRPRRRATTAAEMSTGGTSAATRHG